MSPTQEKRSLSFSGRASGHIEVDADASQRRAMQDSSWADGLRGVSAVFVMFSHLSLCFIRYIAQPSRSLGGPSWWMQKPFLRLVGQGPAWVASFLILSGFVNSLKPTKLARSGQIDTALSNLAVSSFRRSFRLFLPATASTLLSWVLCQLGAYETARHADAYWIQVTTPPRSYTILSAFEDLLMAIRSTWTFNPGNPYDQPQWALVYFLQGSMFVFAALLVTVNLTSRFRMLVMVVLWMWSWNWTTRFGDPVVGPNVFAGIILAEINDTEVPLRMSRWSLLFAPPLTILSLFMMSFPSERQHWTHWSLFMFRLYARIAPEGSELMRFWPTIGAQLLCFTILCSPHLRRIFKQPICLWLGKISFPLYLLHGTVMRTVLSWLLFAGQPLIPMEEERLKPSSFMSPVMQAPETEMIVAMRHPMPGKPVQVIALSIMFVVLGLFAHFWSAKIEPYFGIITKRAEEVMFGKETRPPQLPVRQD